jgi:hypothetical protein
VKAAIYVRVSTPRPARRVAALRSSRVGGTKRLRGRTRLRRSRCLREESTPSGVGRPHRGCAAEEILSGACRSIRPGSEEREALSPTHGRIRQSGNRLARGARWENYDGKTLSVKQSVWGKHTTDPKTASAKKPVPVIQPLRELVAELREAEGNPANGPILRGLKFSKDGKPKPLNLNALARVIRAALLNRETTATAKRRIGSRWSGTATTRSVAASQRS